ncbi:protein phosphatase 2C domain-containing protein [Bacillus timonensis]|nr:protein phosphatase 2C domain-containing protein [Bacillus timonensis]
MELISSSICKAGGRRYNEDSCSCISLQHFHIWIVADGMGGHQGGEFASKLAIDTILNGFKQIETLNEETIDSLFKEANHAILTIQKEKLLLQKMQTTIVLLITDGLSTFIAHVGDSRCYFFRNGRFVTRTQDHSVVQKLVNLGEISEQEIRYHEDRNKILKSLGSNEKIKPTIKKAEGPMQPGDAYLLCTDGFWEYVVETEMEIDFYKSHTPEEWLKRMELRLLKRAKTKHDNYSAIAVCIN